MPRGSPSGSAIDNARQWRPLVLVPEGCAMSLALQLFTLFHVTISLVGIVSGFVVIYGFLTSERFDRCTALFLATTFLTSLTGFGFPVDHFMPSHAVAIVSLVVLSLAT
jgi:hypothetical protein